MADLNGFYMSHWDYDPNANEGGVQNNYKDMEFLDSFDGELLGTATVAPPDLEGELIDDRQGGGGGGLAPTDANQQGLNRGLQRP